GTPVVSVAAQAISLGALQQNVDTPASFFDMYKSPTDSPTNTSIAHDVKLDPSQYDDMSKPDGGLSYGVSNDFSANISKNAIKLLDVDGKDANENILAMDKDVNQVTLGNKTFAAYSSDSVTDDLL